MIPSRRLVVALALLALAFTTLPGRAQSPTPAIDIDAILHDPRAPVAGNPQGDVTIVSFSKVMTQARAATRN